MNKYVFSECTVDYWPTIETVMANSYQDAVDKLIDKYAKDLDDDNILKFDEFKLFREYLNEQYNIALSDLEIYEEI